MTSPARALWDAPPASPPPPRRVWRDWVLVAAIPLLALLEALLRTDVPWRWLWAILLIALVPTLLWRRTRPFTMLAVAFGVGTIVSVATGGDPQLFTTAYFLLLVYAVFRWGSGRAMLGGGALVLGGSLLSLVSSAPTAADVIGGLAVVVTTGTLGVAFRWRAGARARELDRMRLLEREQLARDLHDTVAHHVSAIAIQAQAGTVVAQGDPAAAVDVLRVIEGEASRTLDELRSMVRVLRRTDAADRAPTPGFDDLRRLARSDAAGSGSTPGPTVDVQVDGDVDALPPPVSAAVFRLAQEAVTNARRHARNATRVDVHVRVDGSGVRLDVRDDGEPAASAAPGYGLTGMAERADLLGGTCEAGPAPGGGWAVTAVLPRAGWAT
ncbi:sensor histidine kinase [Agromyces mariniharenae]|uniref:histidine kinase n=1 Tax=Agromyces mariniharenae TaxID=2604423 RepID=A0A5S4V499_9MICO|nr:histidine kinase [Agromyces mariniharenae]TYL52849.1 sensor histidine kinase [Agromyces mariniharenae]